MSARLLRRLLLLLAVLGWLVGIPISEVAGASSFNGSPTACVYDQSQRGYDHGAILQHGALSGASASRGCKERSKLGQERTAPKCVIVATKVGDDLVALASPARRRHILYGDKTGGGHLYPGRPGKTPFPREWDGDRALHEISDVATDPASKVLSQQGGRTVLQGTRGGVNIRVVTDGSDIITGYPTNLPRNPR